MSRISTPAGGAAARGRIGRLLIVLQLVADGVLREPMLYPSLFFNTHRALDYELLDEVRLRRDWERWLDFFAEGIEASATQGVSTADARFRLESLATFQPCGHPARRTRSTHPPALQEDA